MSEKGKEIIALIEKWQNEPGDHDEKYWPLINEILNPSPWQPISSAPKDGWVLISYFDSTGFRCSDAWVSDGGFFLDSDCTYEYEPEAWMPCPEPPEQPV